LCRNRGNSNFQLAAEGAGVRRAAAPFSWRRVFDCMCIDDGAVVHDVVGALCYQAMNAPEPIMSATKAA
jgi:hypothetical protein